MQAAAVLAGFALMSGEIGYIWRFLKVILTKARSFLLNCGQKRTISYKRQKNTAENHGFKAVYKQNLLCYA